MHTLAPRIILLSQQRTRHRPPTSLFSVHREFSWGSKHKNTTSRAGKVCKGFSTRDFAGKVTARKQVYRSILWSNHHLQQYLPRYAPIKEWRFSSSWRKKSEIPSSSRNEAEANEQEDWYTRWEKQKLRQYDDFMKRVEHDPYTALFGRTWPKFSGENTEPKAARTQSPNSPAENSVPRNERTPENWPSDSKSSSKIFGNSDISGRQSKCETTPVQDCDQEYDIDPITNRKVFKTSASPVSTVGPKSPQAIPAGKVFDDFLKRWNLVSPTPLDRRFVMVEHVRPSSDSHLTSKDSPPLKPHNGDGWLAQEGFGNNREPKANAQPSLHVHEAKPNPTATKIESALDRHLSSKSTKEIEKNDRLQLQYKPKENKTEDVDLLRPSDVRASAGLRGSLPKETDFDKQARRQRLEKNYESCSLDRASQVAGEAASNKRVQKKEDRPVEEGTAPELRFGSWLKGTLRNTKPRDKEALKGTSAVWVNELSDAKDFDPVSIDQTSDSTPVPKNKTVSEPLTAVALEAQAEARDKASKLKAQVVPFKAKLDAMKADYDSLRQQWLQEIRRMKEKAAKKEEEVKAQEVAKRVREIHDEEIRTQKKAMEAMEMRSSHGSTESAKTGLAKGTGNDDGEKAGPRRLQSFLQGEGDMASNVHEFAGRNRWYKKKAPHAMDAKDIEMDAKLQRLATDRALIREVRGIYEDAYGTIDTKHRQPHDLSVPEMSPSSRSISSSSGSVDLHAQLPSSSASIIECPRGLDESQSSDAIKIIQKLFGQLREVQAVIQDYRSQTKQALGSNDQNSNTFKTSSASENSVMQIVKTAGQLARVRPGVMIEQGSVKNDLEVQKATKLNAYCILAFDSDTQKVNSAEGTTLAPFSQEESLLPLDALNRLSNPSKFLPHVMSLGDKGYKPVSGTSNILVFKKQATPQESAEMKKTDAEKVPKPIRNPVDDPPVSHDGFIGDWGGNWPSDAIQAYGQAQLQGIEAEQQKIKEAREQVIEKIEKEHQRVEEARKTAIDDMNNKTKYFEDGQKQQSASPVSASHASSDKVRRQETVFSGSGQPRWLDNSVKATKRKRGAGRRREAMKHMLMAAGLTAACCYCVGVASEMMHGW